MSKQGSAGVVRRHSQSGLVKPVLLSALCGAIFIGGVYLSIAPVALQPETTDVQNDTATIKTFEVDTDGIISGQTLGVAGQLRVNNTLVLNPSSQPAQTAPGQVYFDEDKKEIRYYDGSSYQGIASKSDVEEVRSQQPAVQRPVATTPQTITNVTQRYVTEQTINNYQTNGTVTEIADNVFTGTNTFEDISVTDFSASGAATLQGSLNVSGNTSLGPTSASSLLLSSALGVSSGGTGRASFNSNEIVIGQGTGALSTIANGVPGLCLISTAGAPSFQACPGGTGSAGVNTLNGLNGDLTITNSSSVGSTITLDSATTTNRGIASFNASNFTVTGGQANTIQNIGVTAAPTFAGLSVNGLVNGQTISSNANFTGTLSVGGVITANTITPNGSMVIGANGQNLTLQGNASTSLSATSGANTTTLGFAAPSSNVTYRLQSAAAGTYDVCTTAANCVGLGGSVTTSGGTAGALARFSGGQTLVDSILSESGSVISVNGSLSVNMITPTAAMSIGSPAQSLVLQGDGSTRLSAQLGGITNSLLFSAPSGSNKSIVLPNASGTVAVSASGPITLDANGNISCPSCTTGGGGTSGAVDSLNGINGAVILNNSSAAGSTITIDDASTTGKGIASFNSSNFSVSNGAVNTVQDISVSSTPTFNALTLNTPLTVASGGTGASTAAGARTNLGAASSGANTDITSLGGLSTALSISQGGTGATTSQGALNNISQLTTDGDLLYHNGTNSTRLARGAAGQCLTSSTSTIAWGACGPGEADTLATVTARGATTNTGVFLQGGATSRGLTIDTASATDDRITVSVTGGGASSFTGQITAVDLTMNRTWTLPDASGTFCLQGSASCGFALSSGSGNYIQNQNASQQSASNFWLSGIGRADTALQAPSFDTATATALSVGSSNATAINLNQNTVVAANKSLTITGGASRPASPSEGMMYYDSSAKRLIVYTNGKWQADRADAVLVAASNSSQADKDAADYVADGNTGAANDGDQVQIASALVAGTGKKVVLLAGTYTLDDYISVPNNTTLMGVGNGTVLTLPDALNANISLIYNQDSTTGSGVTIQNLRIDGNAANQTSGNMAGITIYTTGGGSGSAARQGARVTNVTVANVRGNGLHLEDANRSVVTGSTFQNNGGNGISLLRSDDSTLTNNVTANNSFSGISLSISSSNTITGNVSRDNAGSGINITSGSNRNTISGNTTRLNTQTGINLTGSSNASINGNNVSENGFSGITLQSGSDNNTVNGNKLTDNGGATTNNGIFVWSATGNQLTGNSISDAAASSNNYAIELYDSSAASTYLSGNTLGGGTVHNLGTGTTYGGQVNSSGSFVVQPASTVELVTNTNITGTLAVSGNTSVTGGALTLGTTTQQGSLVISDGSSNTATLQVGNLSGNYVYSLPVVTGNDTFCLLTLANCTGGGVTMVGALDGGTPNATGASISGATIYLQSASGTNPGLVNTTTQTFAGNKTFSGALSVQDVTVGAGKTIYVTGGTTGTRPGTPSEGMVYFDTTTKQLITYANGKWQADRSNSTVIVAANDSKFKDAADYVVSSADETAGNADVAIQAAISALPANGGSVYLMEGTYTIDTAISLRSNITFTGAGRNLTIIKLKSAHNASINMLSISNGFTYFNNVTIKDLTVDGNKANQTAGTQHGVYSYRTGNQASSTVGLTVNNIYVKDMRNNGMELEQMANSKVSGSYFMTNTGNGIHENSVGARNTYMNNTSRENGASGIDVEGDYSVVSNNYAQANTGYGIDANGSNLTIAENVITNNTNHGVNSTADNAVITGNNISSNTARGLVIDQNAKITNNVIQSNGAGGMYSQYLSNAATITGNTIRSNTGSGIEFNRGGSNTTITGNDIESNTVAGINIYGYLYQLVSGISISSNYIGNNGTYGLTFSSTAHSSVTGNTFVNNGGATTNQAIRVANSYSGNINITGNSITDTSCTTNCYAIALEAGRDILLSNNTIGDATLNDIGGNIYGQGDILDNANNTIYSNQRDGNGNLINRSSGALAVNTKTVTTSLTLQGGMSNSQLPTPAQPSVARVGTSGTTTYGYRVTALDGTGETLPSTERTITNGNAILDGTNYNTVTWTEIPGAVQYKVYRTTSGGTPATTGLISTVTGGANITINDTGLAAGAAVPGANTTGGATFAGGIQGTSAALSGTLTVAGATTLNGTLAATGPTLFKNTANSTTAFMIQDTSSNALFTADTTNAKVVIRSLDVAYNLTVAGHIITGGSAPTIAANAAACTTPTVSVSGTDTAGTITVTTGTGCSVGGQMATVTFASAFGATPKIVLTPASSAAAGLNAYQDDAALTTGSFRIGVVATPTDATTYKWHYYALQ